MANSKYEYVRKFEQSPKLLLGTYIVVRIDGRGFHKLSSKYAFEKPNDRRAVDLMNAAATAVLKGLPDISCAYGYSDEFSFVFNRSTELFDRRESKILTTVVSTFSSYYVHLWSTFISDTALTPPLPSFDGRVVLYPSTETLQDYMSWRQADCHINNLYNTTFWALVQRGGMTATQAEERLQRTVKAEKNEILFSQFQINYNEEDEMYKKGSLIYRSYDQKDIEAKLATFRSPDQTAERSKTQIEKDRKRRMKASIILDHVNIFEDDFWEERLWLLSD